MYVRIYFDDLVCSFFTEQQQQQQTERKIFAISDCVVVWYTQHAEKMKTKFRNWREERSEISSKENVA